MTQLLQTNYFFSQQLRNPLQILLFGEALIRQLTRINGRSDDNTRSLAAEIFAVGVDGNHRRAAEQTEICRARLKRQRTFLALERQAAFGKDLDHAALFEYALRLGHKAEVERIPVNAHAAHQL